MNSHSRKTLSKFLNTWLPFRMQHADIPGFSIAVYVDHQLLFSNAYGVANMARRTPLTSEHRFAMASQVKMLTALALLRLVESGDLHLDKPVVDYLPWLATHPNKQARHITARHLLLHTSGLAREGRRANYWQLTEPFPSADALQRQVFSADFPFAISQRIKYSNLGFALLGQVIEAVTRLKYQQYVTHQILSPFKLVRTTIDRPEDTDQVVTGYTPKWQGYRYPLHIRKHIHSFASVAGLWSTPEEIGKIVDTQLKKQMWQTPQTVDEGYSKGTAFGFGLEVFTKNSQRIVGHSGHIGGQNTATYTCPKMKWTVSVAINCKDAFARQIAMSIFDALYFFHSNANEATPMHLQHFETFVGNQFASVMIIPTRNKILAVDPNSWQPWVWADTLEYIDAKTLRITTKKSVFNEGEYAYFNLNNKNQVVSVNFAGITLDKR